MASPRATETTALLVSALPETTLTYQDFLRLRDEGKEVASLMFRISNLDYQVLSGMPIIEGEAEFEKGVIYTIQGIDLVKAQNTARNMKAFSEEKRVQEVRSGYNQAAEAAHIFADYYSRAKWIALSAFLLAIVSDATFITMFNLSESNDANLDVYGLAAFTSGAATITSAVAGLFFHSKEQKARSKENTYRSNAETRRNDLSV